MPSTSGVSGNMNMADEIIDNVGESQSLNLNCNDIFPSDDAVDDNNNCVEADEFKFVVPKIFDDDVKFGDETLQNIAEMVNTIAHRKANLDEVVKDVKIPANCKNIIPPKVNSEMWTFLRRNVKSLDLVMQGVQKLLGLGMVPIIRMAEKLSKKEFEVKDLRSFTQKALIILSSVLFELSYARKMTLKPNLEPKYHLLCNRNEEIGQNLFGDDVTKRIKEINEAQKTQGFLSRRGSSKNFFMPRGSGARGQGGSRRGQSQSFANSQSQLMDRTGYSVNRGRGRGQNGFTRRPRRF